MKDLPPPPPSYFQAIMEAPGWALVAAIVLMTITVISQVVTRL